jgi:hypothetical protein
LFRFQYLPAQVNGDEVFHRMISINQKESLHAAYINTVPEEWTMPSGHLQPNPTTVN